ncbi:MAG: 4-hydroxyphenylpyruvate dioxygenase [Gammaproteobacteria bacterium]|nr:4-hydroxyphenylpyruvate dioxygenase [Gammaproteobacteria bacterium]
MQTHNPAGTEGFDFLEFTTPDLALLEKQFAMMGFTCIATHRSEQAKILQQNNIRFIINQTKKDFAKSHGASTSAMGFRVKNAKAAYEHALSHGGIPYKEGHNIYNVPAIEGVGGSAIYFVDYQHDKPNYESQFKFTAHEAPSVNGLTYIDHVTHNLHRGSMDKLAAFYENIFNFKEIRYFDIEGKLTGLKSRAMTSPCGKIRIPLNESSDDKSQIEEFLKDFNGEGIQHIALGTNTIYKAVENLQKNGLVFLDTPDTYYELIEKRLPNHGEPVEQLKKLRILVDGHTEDGPKLLLQIFTKNMLGPVFFEIIQRKGDEGFGEGNFKALFESIELDQINRGVLS